MKKVRETFTQVITSITTLVFICTLCRRYGEHSFCQPASDWLIPFASWCKDKQSSPRNQLAEILFQRSATQWTNVVMTFITCTKVSRTFYWVWIKIISANQKPGNIRYGYPVWGGTNWLPGTGRLRKCGPWPLEGPEFSQLRWGGVVGIFSRKCESEGNNGRILGKTWLVWGSKWAFLKTRRMRRISQLAGGVGQKIFNIWWSNGRLLGVRGEFRRQWCPMELGLDRASWRTLLEIWQSLWR